MAVAVGAGSGRRRRRTQRFRGRSGRCLLASTGCGLASWAKTPAGVINAANISVAMRAHIAESTSGEDS